MHPNYTHKNRCQYKCMQREKKLLTDLGQHIINISVNVLTSNLDANARVCGLDVTLCTCSLQCMEKAAQRLAETVHILLALLNHQLQAFLYQVFGCNKIYTVSLQFQRSICF